MSGADDHSGQGRLRAVELTRLTNEPDEAMERLASLAARLLAADVGLVAIVGEDRQFFPGQVGLRSPWAELRETPLELSLATLVVDSADVVRIADTASDERSVARGARAELGIASFLGVPLVADSHALGAICAASETSRAWSDGEVQTLQDLATAASSELRARIAYSVADAARARLQTMADASEALATTFDPLDAIGAMLDVVIRSFGSWSFVVLNPARGEVPQIVARHRDPALRPLVEAFMAASSTHLANMSLTRSVLEGRTARVVTDETAVAHAVSRAGESTDTFAAFGMGAMVVVPLVRNDRIIGALGVLRPSGAPPFEAVDIDLVEDLARRTALTVDHARLYQRHHRIAIELQRSLMPMLEHVTMAEVDSIYLPATVGAEVGGDWCEIVEISPDVVVASIGDVTGHNLDAAAAMGRLQSAIRLLAVEGAAPAEILDRLDAVAGRMLGDLFATCQVVRIARVAEGYRVEIANAGHPQPIVVSSDGEARPMEVALDPLLGAGRVSASTAVVHVLAPHDTMLLFTDGLVEHRSEPLAHGLERARVAARAILAPGEPLAGACSRLVGALGPAGEDDVAAIAIRLG